MSQKQSSRSSLDTVLDVLSDRHRRRLLVELLEHDSQSRPSVQIPDDITVGDEEGERLYVQMYHVHLPKLEAAGLVEWDRTANEMQRGPQFETALPLLDPICDRVDDVLEE